MFNRGISKLIGVGFILYFLNKYSSVIITVIGVVFAVIFLFKILPAIINFFKNKKMGGNHTTRSFRKEKRKSNYSKIGYNPNKAKKIKDEEVEEKPKAEPSTFEKEILELIEKEKNGYNFEEEERKEAKLLYEKYGTYGDVIDENGNTIYIRNYEDEEDSSKLISNASKPISFKEKKRQEKMNNFNPKKVCRANIRR